METPQDKERVVIVGTGNSGAKAFHEMWLAAQTGGPVMIGFEMPPEEVISKLAERMGKSTEQIQAIIVDLTKMDKIKPRKLEDISLQLRSIEPHKEYIPDPINYSKYGSAGQPKSKKARKRRY